MPKRRIPPISAAAKRLPPANAHIPENRNFASIAEERFAEAGYAGKSLLRSIVGQIRCKAPNGNSLLTSFIQSRQGVYAALLGRIMCGSSLSSASTAIGLGRGIIGQWLAKGLNDQANNEDTYYARFASDIHAALAIAVSTAEQAVTTRNPLEYLRSGPGRAFYEREQYWQQPQPGLPPENDFNPLAIVGDDSENSGSLSDNRMAQALEVLRSHGVLTPEYQKQLAEQANLPATQNTAIVETRDGEEPQWLET